MRIEEGSRKNQKSEPDQCFICEDDMRACGADPDNLNGRIMIKAGGSRHTIHIDESITSCTIFSARQKEKPDRIRYQSKV